MAKLSQFAQKSLRDSFKDASGMLTGFGQGIPPVQPAQQFNTGGGLGKSVRNIAGILTGKNFNTPREELQLDLADANTMEDRLLAEIKYRTAIGDSDGALEANTKLKALRLQQTKETRETEEYTREKEKAVNQTHAQAISTILLDNKYKGKIYGEEARKAVLDYKKENQVNNETIKTAYSTANQILGKDLDNLSTAAAGKDIFLDPKTGKRYSLEIYRQEGKKSISEYTEIGNPDAKVTDDIIKRLVTEKGEGQLTEDELRRQREWDTERDSYIANSNKALATIGDLKEAERVLAVVNTGGLNSQWESIKSFFGGGTPDKARINVTFGQFVLERIKELGNNPTDTDLAFLKQMAPNLQAGTQTNLALIKDLLVRLNRVQKKGQWLLENPKASKNDYLKYEAELIKLDQLDQRNV